MPLVEIVGVVSNITFRNEDMGHAVVRLANGNYAAAGSEDKIAAFIGGMVFFR